MKSNKQDKHNPHFKQEREKSRKKIIHDWFFGEPSPIYEPKRKKR